MAGKQSTSVEKVAQDGKCSNEAYSIRTATANSVEFSGIRPQMYIEDLL